MHFLDIQIAVIGLYGLDSRTYALIRHWLPTGEAVF